MGSDPVSSSELFRLAVDLCPAGMLAVDQSGAIVLVNREVERLFGYPRSELIGRPIEMLVPLRFRADHPASRDRYFTELRARPMGIGRDLYGLRKDGSEVPIEIGLNPVIMGERRVIVASVVDIGARRRVEEQLRQSQKMEAIGTMAGGIAHDFNNILLSIIGHAEIVQSTATDPQQRADLDQVLRAAERGRQLVQRILTFSRKREVARVRLELERTVREALQLLRASLPTTIEIRERIDPHTPDVLSDETQLHQVLMNLATNAAHAMPEGGVLRIEVGPYRTGAGALGPQPQLAPGQYARLSVIDDGLGMSAEVRKRAFEPFFTTKAPGLGTGLGLSVIHGIVESHGGAIHVESAERKGTRVDVFLPACVETEAEDRERGPAAKRVLLVDDEPHLAALLERQLTALGYRVSVHTSSVEALERFHAQPQSFHLLITDNTMPQVTGLALAQEVHRARPDLPVLLVSGLGANLDQLRARGVSKILAKPYTMSELATSVEELIGGPALDA